MPKASPILQFRTDMSDYDAVEITVARRAGPVRAEPSAPALDLTGKPSIVMLIGRGGSGKTTLARWLIERASGPVLTAALDPVNRTLANYVNNVSQPETSDPAQSARWLRKLLTFAMDGKHPAVIDFGGGDTTLADTLEAVPDLAGMVDEAGMSLVAFYTMAPRVDDLAPFVALGFQPPATAFVLNDVGDPSRSSSQVFAPLLAQPAVRDAVAAGAQVIRMPRLDGDVVSTIETRRLSFKDASQAGPRGVGLFPAAQVRTWLRGMEDSFAGVSSWLV